MQYLEKENAHLESDIKGILNELNYQKELNSLMHEKVAHLETCLKNSKVFIFFEVRVRLRSRLCPPENLSIEFYFSNFHNAMLSDICINQVEWKSIVSSTAFLDNFMDTCLSVGEW